MLVSEEQRLVAAVESIEGNEVLLILSSSAKSITGMALVPYLEAPWGKATLVSNPSTLYRRAY